MSRAYWKQIHDDDFAVPTDRPLADLTAELTRLLGDVDPDLRDGLALPALATWVERGVYDDLLRGLGDGMAAGLRAGLGETGSDTVFRRSFSVLVLGECIRRDNERPLVPGGTVLDWGDRVATWILQERDLRGYVPGKGWAHAIAHGADALGTLAESPHVGAAELVVVLDVIAERLCLPVDALFTAGEPDRLALAAMCVLRRNRVPFDIVEPWVETLAEAARTRPWSDDRDPFLAGGNAEAFLRALYLQLAMGQRPPAVRADLMLLLVDALRSTNPHYLGPK
ncbi:Protein of unknown function [Nocardioides szechwanensis]|uniref:DUF2785 domain-containing protein n=1 Tax=Nocardioides szechwanensis TaxID=1005944 RepID=A0A1H0IL78_9ACTN|nr:DUF2785 domain-containing protein [Nocardioides szechwanensis]SDO32040.1 Protein of unknown function [Nocardioides szechwanensis]